MLVCASVSFLIVSLVWNWRASGVHIPRTWPEPVVTWYGPQLPKAGSQGLATMTVRWVSKFREETVSCLSQTTTNHSGNIISSILVVKGAYWR